MFFRIDKYFLIFKKLVICLVDQYITIKLFDMLDKNQLDRFIESVIKIETSDGTYLKGILKEVSDNSIVLEFLDGRKTIVSLSRIEFVKEVLK
jgi:hypothetical protein